MSKIPRRHHQQTRWPDVLAQLMEASGSKTRAELSKKSGVAQSTIGRILRGESCPQVGTMSFLAEGLGIPLNTLALAIQGRDESVEVNIVLAHAVRTRARRRSLEKALEELKQEEAEALDRLESLVPNYQREDAGGSSNGEAP